jgi:hypothetical protein
METTTTATIPTSKSLTNKEILAISKRNRPTMDRITEIADELISSHGLSGLYGMTYEAIAASTVKWEYKGLTDGQIYGPFTSQQIADWKNQGFFSGQTAVMLRKVKSKKVAKPALNMFDDEEEEEEDLNPAKKTKVEESSSNSKISEKEDEGNEWVSSDAVDFGSFINLDEVTFDQKEE